MRKAVLRGFSVLLIVLSLSVFHLFLHTPRALADSGPFSHGGPVQHHPKVYLIFWGPFWANLNIAPEAVAVTTVFDHLAGTSYNDILSQYYSNKSDQGSYVYNDTTLAGYYNDTQSTPPILDEQQPRDVTAEIRNVRSNFPNWGVSSDTQYLVFPQIGTAYAQNGDCGWHSYDSDLQAYGLIRYPNSDIGCPFSLTETATHEYAEAATDPNPNPPYIGWSTNNPNGEIADVCNHATTQFYGYTVSRLWSRYDNACVGSYGQQYTQTGTTIQHTVMGLILQKYRALGETNSVLGGPISEEYPIPNSGGSFDDLRRESDFDQGRIYFKNDTGAHEVHGAIIAEYARMGGPTGKLGYPTSDEQDAGNGGRYNTFQATECNGISGSAIYWSQPTGAHEVQGCIYQEYLAQGGSTSGMSFPTSDETAIGNGRMNTFVGGGCNASSYYGTGTAIYWSSSTGAHTVGGCIYQVYRVYGEATGCLGFPVSDEYRINNNSVAVISFANGYISYDLATTAVNVVCYN